MNLRHSMGALHSFSTKNIFYDKMDLRLFYFHVTNSFDIAPRSRWHNISVTHGGRRVTQRKVGVFLFLKSM